jgi:hypothetical protein
MAAIFCELAAANAARVVYCTRTTFMLHQVECC